MHSFRQSRARILFDAFCAFAISASCVGAWMQTYAPALLGVAAVAALYGFVRAFDLAGGSPLAVVEQPDRDGAKDSLPGVPAAQPVTVSQQPVATIANEAVERVEPAAPRKRQSRAKAPRKDKASQASAPGETRVSELAPPTDAEVEVPMPPEEVTHLHIEPLFEPEPFVRMPRQAFGRKAGWRPAGPSPN